MPRLAGKVAVVTGGARGIGRASAELFAREGASVIAADRSQSEDFDSELVEFFEMDVSSKADWTKLDKYVREKHGKLDVTFNNAGVVHTYDNIEEISWEDWNHVFAVNVEGVVLGCKFSIPLMKDSGGGSIINTSSIWGIAGAAGVAAYTASKAAVRSISKNVALSFVGEGIRCNSLHPGIVNTPLIEAQDAAITDIVVGNTPMARLAEPIELAYGALFLASDESSFMTGAELVIDGGYTAQ